MNSLFLTWVLLVIAILTTSEPEAAESAYNLQVAKERCLVHHSQSEVIFMDEFHQQYSLSELSIKFEQIYTSKKRLAYHANYNKETENFYLYYADGKSISPVMIDENFIKSVTLQIEEAISKNYAEFVFFPDIGHAHLHFSLENWESEYIIDGKIINGYEKLYEKMFSDAQMRPLYHLSEALRMTDEKGRVIDDTFLAFRYWNRNFLGKNNGTGEHEIHINPDKNSYNTVCILKNYKIWSAGFAVSANHQACFPYRDRDGTTRYFDISIHDPCFSGGAIDTL